MLEASDLGEAARQERTNIAQQRRDLRRLLTRWRIISSAALILAAGSLVINVILWRHAADERATLGDRVCIEVNETRALIARALATATAPHEKSLAASAEAILKHRCDPDHIERP